MGCSSSVVPVPGPVGKQPIVSLQDSSGALQESTGNTSSGVETVTSSGLTKSLHSSASQVNIDQGQLLIFTMCDERKKVRASVSLLRKEGASMMASTKRTSISFATVTVVESYPGHNNGNTQNTRQRRVSAVASRPSPLLRDISLRNTAAIPHAVAPQPHSSMLDILNNPRLSKEFVRYVLYQSGFASVQQAPPQPRRASIVRNSLAVVGEELTSPQLTRAENASQLTLSNVTSQSKLLEACVSFLNDVARLEQLESAWTAYYKAKDAHQPSKPQSQQRQSSVGLSNGKEGMSELRRPSRTVDHVMSMMTSPSSTVVCATPFSGSLPANSPQLTAQNSSIDSVSTTESQSSATTTRQYGCLLPSELFNAMLQWYFHPRTGMLRSVVPSELQPTKVMDGMTAAKQSSYSLDTMPQQLMDKLEPAIAHIETLLLPLQPLANAFNTLCQQPSVLDSTLQVTSGDGSLDDDDIDDSESLDDKPVSEFTPRSSGKGRAPLPTTNVKPTVTAKPKPKRHGMKTVIVIGGGICGLSVCHQLEAKTSPDEFRIILIDKKDYFEFTPFLIRHLTGTAQGFKQHSPQIPYSELTGRTQFICGKVSNVTSLSVEVNKRVLPYDYLVLCTGVRTRSMMKPQAVTLDHRVDSLATIHLKDRRENVLVIGGGPSGIEFAACSKMANPFAKVTVVSASPTLLPNMRDNSIVQGVVLERLTSLGVNVVLNEKVVGSGHSGGTFAFTNPNVPRIPADRVVWCNGPLPNTAFLRPTFGHILDSIGRIKVIRTLQVIGHSNVFAGGDVCMRYAFEEKTVVTALSHASIISKNILRLVKGQSPAEHSEVKGMHCAVIDMGQATGIQINGVKHSDCDSMSLKLAMYAETVGFWLDNAATLKSAHDSSGSMSS